MAHPHNQPGPATFRSRPAATNTTNINAPTTPTLTYNGQQPTSLHQNSNMGKLLYQFAAVHALLAGGVLLLAPAFSFPLVMGTDIRHTHTYMTRHMPCVSHLRAANQLHSPSRLRPRPLTLTLTPDVHAHVHTPHLPCDKGRHTTDPF